MIDRPPVIDVDGHIQDRASDIRKHLEPPWDRRATALAPGDQPWDRENFGSIRRHPGFGRGLSPAEQVGHWLEIMDEHGIEHVVLFSTSVGAAKLREPDFALAVCRATNTHFAKDWNTLSGRVHVPGVLPILQPTEAAKELRRAVTELGMIGFEILPTGLPVALGDRLYDPIYEEAQRLNVPLIIRGTPSHSQGLDGGSLRTFNEVHTYTIPAGVLLQFTSIVFHGVPVRFPGLRLGFLEIGASWLPYWLDRMDAHWELRGEGEAPLLKKKPSELVRELPIYVSLDADETLLPQTVDYVGEDHFLYSSDLPHWDSQFPESLERLWAHPGLSRGTKEKILYHNAKALLGLPALAATASSP